MQPEETYPPIAHYLARQTSPAESERPAPWVAASAENEQLQAGRQHSATPAATAAAPGRAVYLKSKAFCEVGKNPRRPLRVHSGGLITRVPGTRFNVPARPGARQVAVLLVKGRAERLDQQTTYPLAPGQQWLADRRTGHAYRPPFGPDRVTGCRQRHLTFQHAEPATVADQLTRLSGVKLVFADTTTANVRPWVTLRPESLPQSRPHCPPPRRPHPLSAGPQTIIPCPFSLTYKTLQLLQAAFTPVQRLATGPIDEEGFRRQQTRAFPHIDA